MIGILKNFFTNEFKDNLSEKNGSYHHRLHIATCAILLEMAKIDGEFTESERQKIINIFQNKYNLSDYEISCLIEASNEELERSIDLWQFTSRINKNYSPDEKILIIEMIWQLAYADGKLDKHEDYLVHKLAELLGLSHKHLIDAKLKVLQCYQPSTDE
jgi:uncharacterized tellurite resistance protein B-like protein